MALVISKAAKLKPEICLGQALSEFESLINHEQKIQLHSFSSEIPDATAVMKLTSEIDRKNSNRRSRCIGSRLTNILESVQQFTTVIDVSIGSSQSNIAALTWGGVKLALLVMPTAVTDPLLLADIPRLLIISLPILTNCPIFS